MIQTEMAVHLATHQRRMYCIARSMLGNEQDALDAVAEAAYRACLKCGGVKNAETVAAWLSTVTVNCCRMALRKRRANVAVDMENLPESDETRKVDVREMVERLPMRDREIVLLRYYADMCYADIARRLHMPESTVRSRHKLALKTLKIELEGEEA